jgi:acyl transferase domain-containing protein/acyl carrier protein
MSASEMPDYTVAIIGMSARVPGARNVDEFWRNLCDGVESVTFFSEEELLALGADPSALKNPNYVRAAALLDDIETFDAAFFAISPREAESMDPQQRFFLECAWHALEDAGYDPETYEGLIGCFAGVSMSSYLHQVLSNPEFVELVGSYQVMLGNEKDFLTTHASYKLNLKGPSVVVQTACSTSLAAVHLACQSLLDHQCDMALAGGVTINTGQKSGYVYQQDGIYSPDGHCRSFDANAQGTIMGSGVGIVILKRLAEAIADKDHIYAVIKGSSMNNDGSFKVGFTAPSQDGQAEVITMAQAVAGINPATITYVEAHGTATPIGDPIEIAALTQSFRLSTEKKEFCALGSVKSNFGHLDCAAGVAGLIKTALALKHKMLPPSINFENPNPRIDFANSPFYVNTQLSTWSRGDTPRRAGVSSFGIGGTNAHVVLEEAPPIQATKTGNSWKLLPLSARTGTALETVTSRLAEHFKQEANLDLDAAAYTLQGRRRHFNHRRIIVCKDKDEAILALERPDSARTLTAVTESVDRSVVFMFPGGGAQHLNMGAEVYRTESAFREQVDLCSELLKPCLGFDLRSYLYANEEQEQQARAKLDRPSVALPALFVTEYALAKLWMTWGIYPQAMIGHSLGEYVAGCLAGVFTLEDALALVALRGQLFEQLPEGAMLSVPLSDAEIQPLLNQKLSVAAINSPSLCVVSGATEEIAGLEKQLVERGQEAIRLHISIAAHSHMVEPVLEPFLKLVKTLRLRPPEIPYISNVTGTWITAEEATEPHYWTRHLRHTVQFAEGIRELWQKPDRILLEVGPGRTLSSLAKHHPSRSAWQVALSSLRHPDDPEPELSSLLTALGQLWLAGKQIDWSGFNGEERRLPSRLPSYPFEGRRYWIEPKKPTVNDGYRGSLRRTPDISDWFYIASWKRTMPRVNYDLGDRSENSCWMLLADTHGLAETMAKRLREQGQKVIAVTIGDRYDRLGDDLYSINPQKPSDYAELIAGLKASELVPENITHFWSLSTDEPVGSSESLFEESQVTGYYSLLFLTQALEKERFGSKNINLVVVSNHLHDTSGGETIYPEKTTLLGPCQVVPQEHTNISCRSIDIALPGPETKQQVTLADHLLAEIVADSSDTAIALRDNQRFVLGYERVRLERKTRPVRELRKNGVYLFTGGLGGVGLHLAEHFAKTVQARLVLVGRTALPERAEWETWLETHDETDAISRKIQKVLNLEELGAEVLVLSADVADEMEMRSVVALAEEKYGPVNGVLHLAADTNIGSIVCPVAQNDPIRSRMQMRPKVYGTYVLEKVLGGRELDFCILFSSNASVLGGLGLVAYSAANHFLDAFANRQNGVHGLPWISTNWDGWPSNETDAAPGQSSINEYAMDARESIEAFDLILSMATVGQIITSAGDLNARRDIWIKREFLRAEEEEDQSEPLHSRPPVRSAYAPPVNEVQQKIVEIWEKLLGIEQVGIHDEFLELGGHSLLAIQLTSRLRETFQVEVPVRTIFESPTIAGLEETISKLKDGGDARSSTIIPVTRERYRVNLSSDGAIEIPEKAEGNAI